MTYLVFRTTAELKDLGIEVYWKPEKIISGGQTGVDRAGLEAAMFTGRWLLSSRTSCRRWCHFWNPLGGGQAGDVVLSITAIGRQGDQALNDNNLFNSLVLRAFRGKL